MSKKIYEIDGEQFSNLEEFWDEISEKIIPDVYWGRNLDAFNDILYGGFGTPEEGFILIWKNSQVSKVKLGYSETMNWLENTVLKNCHPLNKEHVKKRIQDAKQNKGETLFEIIVEIMLDKEHSDIELRLE
jgi:RNAse (barnase) inhibitor barstar